MSSCSPHVIIASDRSAGYGDCSCDMPSLRVERGFVWQPNIGTTAMHQWHFNSVEHGKAGDGAVRRPVGSRD